MPPRGKWVLQAIRLSAEGPTQLGGGHGQGRLLLGRRRISGLR
eukprot:CAMPEP_0195129066 /NCGR_PEP_ID=MMETSP0448-20130528/140437_1 /TAXON_ID=66468 /ORGANISM="Heterocapsa triquestra, Strain CCMP 448" /LENGTH=42 /DNA_ID= /DNA_START= /DNA_END= /DNA_ORIENTATION=